MKGSCETLETDPINNFYTVPLNVPLVYDRDRLMCLCQQRIKLFKSSRNTSVHYLNVYMYV